MTKEIDNENLYTILEMHTILYFIYREKFLIINFVQRINIVYSAHHIPIGIYIRFYINSYAAI